MTQQMIMSLTHSDEMAALRALVQSLPRGSRCLELGTFLAGTWQQLAFLRPDCEFWTIDHYLHYPHPWEQLAVYRATGQFQPRTLQLVQELVKHRTNLHCLEGHIPDQAPPGPWHMIFEDSDHTEEGLSKTLPWIEQNISKRGYLCMHDYRPEATEFPLRWPAVERACEELRQNGWHVDRMVNSLVVFQKN